MLLEVRGAPLNPAALLPVGEARRIIESLRLREPQREAVPTPSAVGRLSAEDVRSPRRVPERPLAAMDGYALASGSRVEGFRIVEGSGRLGPGEAAPVETGEPLPEGADAVLRREAARVEGGLLYSSVAPRPWENVFMPGEFIEEGQLIVPRGGLITGPRAAMALQAGLRTLRVYRVRAALVVAGRGVEPATSYTGGNLDFSLPLLAWYASFLEVAAVIGPVAQEMIGEALAAALGVADVVVVAGGASIGGGDSAKRAAMDLGGDLVVPGFGASVVKRSGLAVVDGKPVVFLPGGCVSAALGLHEVLLRVMKGLTGRSLLATLRLPLARPLELKRRMPAAVLLRLADGGWEPLEWGVNLCRELARADAYAILEPGRYPEGAEVEAVLLGPRG